MKNLLLIITICLFSCTAFAGQHDYDINTADANTGVTMRAAINSALQALVGNNSGATAPATTYPYMWWADTTTATMQQRNAANTGWIAKGPVANPVNSVGADIASATTTDLSLATGDYVKVTGTTTITGLGTAPAGSRRTVEFTGTLTVTHNATSLILPGAINITTAAGDVASFVSLGSGNWKCTGYQPGSFIQPTGMVNFFAMNSCPAGYLAANGSAVSRTTYAALFAATGTIYGSGNGSTTFNLIDLRGEFIRGWDNGRGVDSGRAFGSAQADDLKSHTHTQGSTSSVPSSNVAQTGWASASQNGLTGATGGTETRPRNIALQPCIKY